MAFFSSVFLGVSSDTATADGDSGFALRGAAVLEAGPQGAWDALYVDPGAVIFHDGKFHMFYSALPKWPHPAEIGYASSSNGVEWVKSASNPILTIGNTGFEGYAVMSSGAIVTEQGQWVLYFSIVRKGKIFYGSIGRATASSPLGPWKVDAKPVLEPGPKGAWDANMIGDASVLKTAEGYVMYYTGFGNVKAGAFIEEHGNIGLARSTDGINWTKHDDPATTDGPGANSDPVFRINGAKDAWDTWKVFDPNVQKTGDGWTMVYRGTTFTTKASIGLATSDDGITWRRDPAGPVLRQSEHGETIDYIDYLRHGGKDMIFIESGTTSRTRVILMTRPNLTR